MTKSGNLPVAWKISSLQDICDIQAGNAWTSRDYHYEPPGMPIIRITNLGDPDAIFRYWRDEYDPRYVVSPGDLLLSITGYLKVAIWSGEKGLLNQSFVRLTPKDGIDKRWLLYQLLISLHKINIAGNQAVVNNITLPDLCAVEILVPPLPEQKRIAEILSAADDSINNSQILIAKLQDLKTGTMQELLSTGIGHTDFKNSLIANINEDWHTVKLGDVLLDIDSGKSPDCPNLPAAWDEWGLLKVGAIQPSGFVESENKTVVDSAHICAAYEVKDGDLLFSRANSYEFVGLVCYVERTRPKLMLSDKTLRLTVNPQLANKKYIFHVLQIPSVKNQIEKFASGSIGTMKNIRQGAIRNIVIPLPCISEQECIADVADAIDVRIRTKTANVQRLKNIKTALMQDLLTGRVRVKV
jgi:type I restriction enzyme S subunit